MRHDGRHGQNAAFPTPHWSLVARAGGDGTRAKGEALATLLARYVAPMRAHVERRTRVRPDRAEDLVQSFLAVKVLEHDLVARAEQSRGKFRTFLLTALDRFVVSELRRERARKRTPDQAPAGLDDVAEPAASDGGNVTDVFDVEWARQVLAETVLRMQQECDGTGRADIWAMFDARILAPMLRGEEPVAYEQLVREGGLVSPAQASNLLITAKRMFARVLRGVVAEYAREEAEIEEELRDLREILARPGAGSVQRSRTPG